MSNLFLCILKEFSNNKLPTIQNLNTQLNLAWSKIKKHITFDMSPNDYVIFQSFAKRLLHYFTSTFKKVEVIFIDQIFDYHSNGRIIQVPLSAIRSSSDIYVYYLDDGVFYQDIPVGYSFLGPIVYKLGREICKGHRYGMHPIIYRSQSLRTYQCIDNSRVDESLVDLMRGIELKIFYPRVSLQSCKLCLSKESCKWYESTKTN